MLKAVFAIILLGCASGQVPTGRQWKEIKSPLHSPRYYEIFQRLFPTISGQNLRGVKIAGGDFAQLGQFPFQALLMSMNSLGDTFLCGGTMISYNWILTVSFMVSRKDENTTIVTFY